MRAACMHVHLSCKLFAAWSDAIAKVSLRFPAIWSSGHFAVGPLALPTKADLAVVRNPALLVIVCGTFRNVKNI